MGTLRAWLILGLVVAVLWLFRKVRSRFWLFALLVLPGTCCHELCHYLAGLLLNGRPVAFTVLPRREGDRIQLGAVLLANIRWYNGFFIGLAPLAMLPGACRLFQWTLARRLPFGPSLLLLAFLVANLAYGAIPSGQDWRMAARSPVGWLLLAGVLVYAGSRWQAPARTGRHRAAGGCPPAARWASQGSRSLPSRRLRR